jgi:hypothetical protein
MVDLRSHCCSDLHLFGESMSQKKTVRKYENKDEIISSVLSGMRNGLSAFKACQSAGVPHSTFMEWLKNDAELADNYARAREDLIERIACEVLELSDADVGEQPDGKKDWAAVQKHKLQVDSRKWLLSKLAPKKYGDKLELSGDEKSPLAMGITVNFVKPS